MQKVWVPSLVRELGSHINLRQKQYCNKSKKDFKNGPHQEKKKSSKKNKNKNPAYSGSAFRTRLNASLRIFSSTPHLESDLVPGTHFIRFFIPVPPRCIYLYYSPTSPPKDINHVLFILEASALRIWTSAYQMQCLYLLSKRTNKCQPQVTLELRFENMGQI